jgi:hypothetical protein
MFYVLSFLKGLSSLCFEFQSDIMESNYDDTEQNMLVHEFWIKYLP